eukprot:UN09890
MRENEKSSFFQKLYSESSQYCFYFYHFWESDWHRFRLKNSLPSNGIGYAFKTSPSSHGFPTKQLRVFQATPITLQSNLKVKNLISNLPEYFVLGVPSND